MNYSEQNIQKKMEKIASDRYKKKYRLWGFWRYFRGLCIIGLVIFGGYQVSAFCRDVVESTEKMVRRDFMKTGTGSILYDSKGKEIQKIDDTDISQQYVKISRIPKVVRQAFLAAEDVHFYEHHGVDVQEMLQSIYQGVVQEKRVSPVNTTITKQLIDSNMLEGEAGYSAQEQLYQRVKEQYLAISLEDELDKDTILEMYLNVVNLGENILGVQAAARSYLNKDIDDVTMSEATVLASIVSDPVNNNPKTGSAANAEKRKVVLKNMLDVGYISEDEYEDALGDDVYLRIQRNAETGTSGKSKENSYYVDAAIEQVMEDMKNQLGYSQTQVYNALYRDGVRIYTCQDMDLQKICDDTINDDRYYASGTASYLSYELVVREGNQEKNYNEVSLQNFFSDEYNQQISNYFTDTKLARKYIRIFKKDVLQKGGVIVREDIQLVKQPQASCVLMEQGTGEVKAIVGGRGARKANRKINRATKLERQPGTLFDILSTVTPALDTAGITLADVQNDVDYLFPDTLAPVNTWTRKGTQGLVTLRDAIQQPLSVPMVKTLEQVSIQTGYDYLKRYGITTLVEQKEIQGSAEEEGSTESDLQYTMAVGRLTEGVTNLEMTAAYAAIAGEGIYRNPGFYTKVVDKSGNILLDRGASGRRIMKESTAWLLTDTMKGKVLGDKKEKKTIFVAGRSGQTALGQDAWYEGYTPYYTAGIWIGQDEGEKLSGKEQTRAIWEKIMKAVHQKKKIVLGSYEKPADIVSRDICTKCGKLAVKGLCENAEGGSTVRKEYFVKGTEPNVNCNCHVKYQFCGLSNRLATESCPKEKVYQKVLLQKQETVVTADTPYTVQYQGVGDICEIHGKKEQE